MKKCPYCGGSEFCLGRQCGEEYRRWKADQERQRRAEYDGFDNEDVIFDGGRRSDAGGRL